MTKSTITREESVQAVFDLKVGYALELADIEILKRVARMALAAMDSEPVAVVEPSDYVTAAQLVGEGPARKAVHELYEGALRIGDKLYRHAQPALVPDKMTYQDGVLFVLNNDMSSIERGTVAMRAWNACRAAMLAAAPQEVQVVSEKIEQSRKKIDRCDVCTEGARGGCGTCIFNGNFE